MNLDFIGKRATFYLISSIVILVSFGLIGSKGLNLGIEFKSGSVFRLTFQEEVSADDVRKVLSLEKFRNFFKKYQVQQISDDDKMGGSGAEFFVTSDFIDGSSSEVAADRVVEAEFQKVYPSAKIHEFINIGAAIGDDLKIAAVYSIVFSILVIILYITIRFEFQYSLVAIAALVHDVVFVLGIFALTQREFSSSTIAAILTIIGYSLNDTIVVLDRIRENVKLLRKERFDNVVNTSINQSLSRTVNTSITTLAPICILFFFGGTGVATFSFAMLLGVLVGTYSSICLASPLLVTWNNSKQGQNQEAVQA